MKRLIDKIHHLYSLNQLHSEEIGCVKQYQQSTKLRKGLEIQLGNYFKIDDKCIEADRMTIFDCYSSMDTQCSVDYRQLPLLSNSVKQIIIPHVLFYLSKKHQLDILNEVYRVLEPEGKLIVFEFSADSLWRLSRSARSFLPPRKLCQNPESFERKLQQLGFSCEKVMKFDFSLFKEQSPAKSFLLNQVGQYLWSGHPAAFAMILNKPIIHLKALDAQVNNMEMMEVPVMNYNKIVNTQNIMDKQRD